MTACEGQTKTITATPKNILNFLYQWQVSTDNGATWKPISNNSYYADVNSPTLKVTPPLTFNNYQFRCRMTILLTEEFSSPVTLSVTPLLDIVLQPMPATAMTTEMAIFTVVANDLNAAYQWQVNKGDGWVPLSDGDMYSGASNSTLYIVLPPWYMHHYQYRCEISGPCDTKISDAATLIIEDLFTYIGQPEPATICDGKDLQFTFGLKNASNATYQWQESRNGGTTWTNLSEGQLYQGGFYSQVKASTLKLTSALALSNNFYRCQLTQEEISFTSEAVKLTVLALPAFTQQPASMVTCSGTSTAFATAATGYNNNFQWQVNPGDGTWTNVANNGVYSGAQTNILSLASIPQAFNSYQYRCVVTGDCALDIHSVAATLTVIGPNTWKGITSTWQDANNWCGGIPTAATNITIQPGIPHMPQAAGATCRDLTIQSGAYVTMTGNFTIHGTPFLSGNLIVGAQTLTLNGGPIMGTPANLLTGASSNLVMGGSATGVTIPASISALNKLTINNPSVTGINLLGHLTLESLEFQQGRLFLNTSNLKMQAANTISGADSTRYVVTNDDPLIGGSLIQPIVYDLLLVLQPFITFPVGTAKSYSPAKIKLQLGSTLLTDDFSVRVFDKVYENGTTGNLVTNSGVNKTWLIDEASPGGSVATVSLGWLKKDELQGFKNNKALKAHFKNSKWEYTTNLLGFVQDLLNVNWAAQGTYTDFSPFAVLDERVTQAVANVRVFLQGPYNASTGKMNTTLRTKNLIPLSHPYSGAPWNYTGTEAVAASFLTNNPDVVDWVLLEIRSNTTTKVKTLACFLKSDGSLLGADGLGSPRIEGVSDGNYYIVIKHRNHFPIMSAGTAPITSSSAVCDLSGSIQNIYGFEAITLKAGAAPILGGVAADINGDGEINSLDSSSAWNFRNRLGYLQQDTNFDGEVNSLDKGQTWNNKNRTKKVQN